VCRTSPRFGPHGGGSALHIPKLVRAERRELGGTRAVNLSRRSIITESRDCAGRPGWIRSYRDTTRIRAYTLLLVTIWEERNNIVWTRRRIRELSCLSNPSRHRLQPPRGHGTDGPIGLPPTLAIAIAIFPSSTSSPMTHGGHIFREMSSEGR
jgi:hypothetical protein